MYRDGPKLIGRYIKQKTKLASCVDARNYSFEEISSKDVQTFDNVCNSIIHHKLHDPEAVNRFIKPSVIVGQKLQEDEQVLWPRNFTNDWMRERDRQKRRGNRTDDDDFELEQELNQAGDGRGYSNSKSNEQQPSMEYEPSKASKTTVPSNPPPMETASQFKKHLEGIDVVGKAIRELTKDPDDTLSENFIPESMQSPLSVKPEVASEPVVAETPQVAEPQNFTPSTPPVVNPVVNETEVAEIKTKAEKEGFATGFSVGEEKALLKTQESLNKLFGNLGSLLTELGSLKQNILLNVQETFYEICQGLGESLLGREFTVSKTAFAEVLKTAIRDTVPGDQFKIQLNPKTFDLLEKSSMGEYLNLIEKNTAIPENDFRIVSNLTTVDGNLKQIIQELVHRIEIGQIIDPDKEKSKAS